MCVTGLRCAIVTAVCFVLASPPAVAQGITQPKQGQGGSVVKGAAGTEGSTGDKGLEHCDKPMGAMAVVEPQSEILIALHALQPAVARRTDSPDDPAVQLLHRRRARRGHAEHDAGARAGIGAADAAGVEHRRRADGGGGLHPDAGGRVFGEQRRRRGRRRGRPLRRQSSCGAWPAA